MTAKKAELHVVKPEPDMPGLERVLIETAQHQAPMIARAESSRQKLSSDGHAFVAELETVRERRALAERHHEALMRAFDAEEADLEATIALYAGVPADA